MEVTEEGGVGVGVGVGSVRSGRRRNCRTCGQLHQPHEPHLYDYIDDVDEDVTCHICLQVNTHVYYYTPGEVPNRVRIIWCLGNGK